MPIQEQSLRMSRVVRKATFVSLRADSQCVSQTGASECGSKPLIIIILIRFLLFPFINNTLTIDSYIS